MNEIHRDQYSEAIGSVVDARRRFDEATATQGVDSLAAQQAHEYLKREISHRDGLRVEHDATAAGRSDGRKHGFPGRAYVLGESLKDRVVHHDPD